MYEYFLILLLGHLFGDFILQSDYIINKKQIFVSKLYSKALAIHISHHFLVTTILLILFGKFNYIVFLLIVLISIVHYVIDLLKVKYKQPVLRKFVKMDEENKYSFHYFFEKNTTYFMLDQALHISVVYILLLTFGKGFTIGDLLEQLSIFLFSETLSISTDIKVLLSLSTILLLTYGSAQLISTVMSDMKYNKNYLSEGSAAALEDNLDHELAAKIKSNKKEVEVMGLVDETIELSTENERYSFKIQYNQFTDKEYRSKGKYIGILERILIAFFIFFNAYQGLILLGAVKTLARFKNFEDRNFAEYYLVGTLFSILLGALCSVVLKRILI